MISCLSESYGDGNIIKYNGAGDNKKILTGDQTVAAENGSILCDGSFLIQTIKS